VEVVTGGNPPHPRCDHRSVVCKDKLYIFGGSGSENLWYNDLHVLDLSTNVWLELSIHSTLPPPCDFAALCGYDDNYIMLFGGSNDSLPDETFNKVWYYSISSGQWYTANIMGAVPPARYSHSAVMYNNLMYIVGGLGDSVNDVWLLQLNSHCMSGHKLPPPLPNDITAPSRQFTLNDNITLPSPATLTSFTVPVLTEQPGLAELKEAVIAQISNGFDTLNEEYSKLYIEKGELTKERAQLDRLRIEQDQYMRDQREDLVRQCEEHTATCKKWAEEKVVMFTQEREVLVEERKRLERAQQRLADERDLLQQRVKRLDSLMERVKT